MAHAYYSFHNGRLGVATVQTVHGPVEAAPLGRVLTHEHVFVLGTEIRQNYPDAWGDEEQITTMLVDNPRHYFGG